MQAFLGKVVISISKFIDKFAQYNIDSNFENIGS